MAEGIREECGTITGTHIHSRLGEPQCALCRERKKERDAEYESRPYVRRRRRIRSRADVRTYARMKRMFPAEYLKVRQEEIERATQEELENE